MISTTPRWYQLSTINRQTEPLNLRIVYGLNSTSVYVYLCDSDSAVIPTTWVRDVICNSAAVTGHTLENTYRQCSETKRQRYCDRQEKQPSEIIPQTSDRMPAIAVPMASDKMQECAARARLCSPSCDCPLAER